MEEGGYFAGGVFELYDLISPYIRCTPLLRSSLGRESGLFLKCENFQHTHSFKYRGAFSALSLYERDHPSIWEHILRDGVVTYSTGNFAKALAYITHEKNIKLTVLLHEWVDRKKLESILNNNPETTIVEMSLEAWQEVVLSGVYSGSHGFFIPNSLNDYVSLGNATMGMEIIQQLPELNSIIIPYGSGNLTYSLCLFFKHFKPSIDIYTVEVSSGMPFASSFKAGKAIKVPYKKTFVDGIGAGFVIPEQFDRIQPMIKDALVVTPQQIAKTLVQLATYDKLLVEGAGAAAVAAGIRYHVKPPTCCVVSGGNIDPLVLISLLKRYSTEEVLI
jgi:threonine dehydratase